MASGLKLASTDAVLGGIIGGVVVIILGGWLIFGGNGGGAENRIHVLSVPVTLEADWGNQTTTVGLPDDGELVIYLDVSHSMGGFVPMSSVGSSTAGLSTAAQLLPGYLVSAYGGRPTRWKSVAREVRSLPSTPAFVRELFVGSQTLLEPAVEDALASLDSGQVKAAVFVTDLVATSGPESAMAVARPLEPWVAGPAVHAGVFDVGLLGARSTYWGVHSSTCLQRGELGCWYSEHANSYLPLSEPVDRPFYFLVLGQAEGAASTVDRLGRQIAKELQELGLDTRWELLTGGIRPAQGLLECQVWKKEKGGERGVQYALVRQEDGTAKCQREDLLELDCQLRLAEPGGDRVLPLLSGRSTWSAVEVEIRDGHLYAEMDCARLRSDMPGEDFRFLDLAAAPAVSTSVDWSSWAAFSDEHSEDLKGTLQLNLFLNELRLQPERYKVDSAEPLLKVVRRDE